MCKYDHSEYLIEEELERELKNPPREALAEARVFVEFACRCLRETPVGGGKTAVDLLTDSRLRTAVEAAETWVRTGAVARLTTIIDEALSAADEPTDVREKTAADAAATAVWAAGDAVHVPSLGANLAVAAAAKVRRTAATLLHDCVHFQWELARQLWPGLIRDFPLGAPPADQQMDLAPPRYAMPGAVPIGFPSGLRG